MEGVEDLCCFVELGAEEALVLLMGVGVGACLYQMAEEEVENLSH